MPIVTLIGAPTDIGAGHRGASMGPEALRVAHITEALRERGLEVEDRGNLTGPTNPWAPPVNGYRHLPEVVQWNRSVYHACMPRSSTAACRCCLAATIASVSVRSLRWRVTVASRARSCCVLWLDAHADFNTSEITPSGNVHGMPVACLCGNGPRELTHLGGDAPALRPDQIRQIGIRSVDAGEKPPGARASASTSTTCATSTRSASSARWKRRWMVVTPTLTCT
jgi:arginase